jgi:hypothetical protein
MLDGQLRGRNELVADSIQRDTGVPRDRKQVSSHIQVLKNILQDQPQSKYALNGHLVLTIDLDSLGVHVYSGHGRSKDSSQQHAL